MIVIHATIPVVPEKRDEASELMQELAEKSRTEDGVRNYRVTTDVEDPNTFRFFEHYESGEAFSAHTATDHFGEFAAALPELLAGEPTITRYEVESATDVEM